MQLPQAIMVVDIKRELVSVKEANKMGIPVIGIVDTNSDPTLITYPIPANDDAVGSVRLLIETLTRAYKEGKEAFEKNEQGKVAQVSKEAGKTERKEIVSLPAGKAGHQSSTVAKAMVDKADIRQESKKEIKEVEVGKTISKAITKNKEITETKEEQPKKKRGRPMKTISS